MITLTQAKLIEKGDYFTFDFRKDHEGKPIKFCYRSGKKKILPCGNFGIPVTSKAGETLIMFSGAAKHWSATEKTEKRIYERSWSPTAKNLKIEIE